MKREILFRAQRIDNGKWIEGQFYHSQLFIDGKNCNDVYLIRNDIDEDYFIKENTVCQFTSLTDKNGTKAFDKDLIKAPSGRIYAIIWATWIHDEMRNKFLTDIYEFTGWCISKDGVNPCDLLDSEVISGEIIGNLIDSPELLK